MSIFLASEHTPTMTVREWRSLHVAHGDPVRHHGQDRTPSLRVAAAMLRCPCGAILVERVVTNRTLAKADS